MIEFGNFGIDIENRQLLQTGQPVALTPKAYAVLTVLVEAKGMLVTKQSLMEQVWTDTVVSDAALTVCIREIRKALGESARSPRFITTLHKRGYCFTGSIKALTESVPAVKSASPNQNANALIKRQAETKALSDAISLACKGHQQLIFVSGEAGMGKSTLVENFIYAVKPEPIEFTRGQCIEHYGHAEPYLPWLDAITKLCRKDDGILEMFKQHAPMWLLQMPSLLNSAECDELERRLAGTSSQRMMREMLDALQVISADSPLVIYLEDLHFSDEASVQLLRAFACRREPSQLMIIACYRPQQLVLKNHPLKLTRQELEVRGYCKEIRLEPFSHQQINNFIDNRLPDNTFPDSLANAIERRSEGNPLFVTNIIEYLIKEKLIDEVQGQWTLCCDEQTVKTCMPDTLMQMLGYHIEQLDTETQTLLEAAAVACNSGTGEVQFSISQVAIAADKSKVWVEDMCQKLAHYNHFITDIIDTNWQNNAIKPDYSFTHGFYQQAFYKRLTPSRRASLHEKIGNHLESSRQHNDIELDSKLAVHFEQARNYSKAAFFLKNNAQTASKRGVYSEAKNSLMRAISLSTRLADEQQKEQITLESYISLGPILIAEKGNTDPEVEEHYLRAHELCKRVGHSKQMFPIVFGLRSFHLLSGHLNKAHELSKDLLFIAHEVGDDDLLLEAHVGLASSAFFLGKLTQSLSHANDGIKQYQPEQHAYHVKQYGLDPGVFCYSRAAQTRWMLGYPDRALENVTQSLNLAKQLEHPYSLAFALNNCAWVSMYRHEPESTLDYAIEAVTLASEYGFPFYKVWGQIMQGWALCCLGETQKGIILSRASIEESKSMSSAIQSYLFTVLADVYLHAKDYDKGLSVLDQINNNAEYFLEAQRFHLRGMLLESKAFAAENPEDNDIQDACSYYEKSITFARSQKARSFELRASISLARVLIRQGNKTGAHALLKPIVDEFTETDEANDVITARTMLDECAKAKVIRLKNPKSSSQKNTA